MSQILLHVSVFILCPAKGLFESSSQYGDLMYKYVSDFSVKLGCLNGHFLRSVLNIDHTCTCIYLIYNYLECLTGLL